MQEIPTALAARRVPLETPPSDAEERRVERMQVEVRKRIGARVHRLRTEAGLSFRALGMRVNLSPTYLSEIEQGLRAPTSDALVRLGHFMNVSPAFFLTDDE